MKNAVLAQALESFSFGDKQSGLTFAQRLASENLWTEAFAKRVIQEYLRFVYLACVSDHPVTPSIEVDQAWHLHLCYTRSYWNNMCRDILQHELHHGPTRGGQAEDAKFRLWYEHTLTLYRLEFSKEPPKDIWPDQSERFSYDNFPVNVTNRHHIVIDKRRARTLTKRALLLIGAGLSAGALTSTTKFPSAVILIGAIVLFLIIFWWLKKDGGGKGGSGGSSCGGGDSGCGAGCGGD